MAHYGGRREQGRDGMKSESEPNPHSLGTQPSVHGQSTDLKNRPQDSAPSSALYTPTPVGDQTPSPTSAPSRTAAPHHPFAIGHLVPAVFGAAPPRAQSSDQLNQWLHKEEEGRIRDLRNASAQMQQASYSERDAMATQVRALRAQYRSVPDNVRGRENPGD